jgi:hypothetical protein
MGARIFKIRRRTFDMRRRTFDMRRRTFDMRRRTFDMRRRISNMRRRMSEIQKGTSEVPHMSIEQQSCVARMILALYATLLRIGKKKENLTRMDKIYRMEEKRRRILHCNHRFILSILYIHVRFIFSYSVHPAALNVSPRAHHYECLADELKSSRKVAKNGEKGAKDTS